jgi:spore maturation protein CgeB
VRALVVGPYADFAIMDVARGWVNGLRECGVQTAFFDIIPVQGYHLAAQFEGEPMSKEQARAATGLALTGEVYRIDPDVVFVIHGADIDPAAIAALRCTTVAVFTESPYENEGQMVVAEAMQPDLILVNDPVGAEAFESVAPTFYSPHCFDPTVHFPAEVEPQWDSLFVGTLFRNRLDFFEAVDWTDIKLGIGGLCLGMKEDSPLWPFLTGGRLDQMVDNRQTADMYRRTRTGFSLYRTDSYGEHSHADGIACGPREIELAACGVWFARDARAEGDELFPHLPIFSEPAELGDLIRWALAHQDERYNDAYLACEAVQDRTFAKNVARVLTRLGAMSTTH